MTDSITNETPIWFENGLAGIGWVVIYLYQNQYIDGDVNIILNCCDRLLTKRDVRRINDLSLEKGLRGIACYVSARIEMDLDHPLLDDQFINELFERCKDLGVSQYSVSMEALCEYMMQKSNTIPILIRFIVSLLRIYYSPNSAEMPKREMSTSLLREVLQRYSAVRRSTCFLIAMSTPPPI